MRKIAISLGRDSYEVHVGVGLLGGVGNWLKDVASGKAVIITDPAVNRLYGEKLARGLTADGLTVSTLLVPEGEEHKSLDSAIRLYQGLTEARAERGTPILALGGGVIGDLAGFVAATYLRGVPLVQLPTTLLAQVDSSVGGKVAVDHGSLKNMIGTFYQPKRVIADIDTLKSLPATETANGLAEVIKSAAILNGKFFAWLEDNIARIESLDAGALEEAVFQTASIKARVVEKDERDLGLRGLLNFGHTIGHAIESVSDFKMKHGRAVAIGMVAAAIISNRMGMLDADGLARLTQLLRKAGLPAEISRINVAKVMRAMKYDKKVQRERVRFILLEKIGSACICDTVSPSLVEEVLRGA